VSGAKIVLVFEASIGNLILHHTQLRIHIFHNEPYWNYLGNISKYIFIVNVVQFICTI